MSSTISFWQLNENARAAAAAANDRITAVNTQISKLFTNGNPNASKVPNVMTPTDTTSIINGFGQAFLNHSMSAAILAAQAGNDRVNKMTAEANGQMTTKPVANLTNQVTWSGALSVDFGQDGPAAGGGYHFKSGTDLKTAVKTAVGAYMSEGEAIDTYSVVGNTLTGSTSGANAHDVFTLTLHPDSGLYTFQLVAPIDVTKTKGNYKPIYLNGLIQAVTSKGQKLQVPTVEMDVYNDLGQASGKGNWGLLHEAALTYQDSSQTTTSSSSSTSSSTSSSATGSSSSGTKKTYTPPTDTRTNYAYTSNPSAALAVINSVNIFS